MAAGVSRKISAASARSHTRKSNSNSSSLLSKGIFKKLLLVFFTGFLAWAYQATRPPPPKTCGSPDGPPVTAPRIKLRDGRYLSYIESGVPKDTAKYKIIFVHGFSSCKYHSIFATKTSPTLIEELRMYTVSFDKPGYGESDPDPKRTQKSLALDIEELADQLELGPKFYVSGFSMGGHAVWSCLKYIPHRLAGAVLIAPVVNWWWPHFPSNLTKEVYSEQFQRDIWCLRVAHHLPWLTYWWNTQTWFPRCAVFEEGPAMLLLSRSDMELVSKLPPGPDPFKAHAKQQGEYESLHRDLIIGFGKWEFDPMDLENPFPNKEGSVHLWMGDDDLLVPVKLQRYIAQQLPWIKYHEIPNAGHMFPLADGMADAILKELLDVKE